MIFDVKLSRPATEFAFVRVDASNEIEALNIAFKEIDRLVDVAKDRRVKSCVLELKPSEDPWEEESVTTC